ncbi:MAG: uroporphyrinogen decarboxylase [Spirochaetaceae bacterium]|jgi:uroporphyrinogen decarboxylase|nr:uroporphyrinogen decarboxylase [Spirochaetaceae bacterium]
MTKRELVLRALRGERVERVPIGFWFHFVDNEAAADGLKDDSFLRANFEGHRKFYTDFKPDLVKIMSDGFFVYPNELFAAAKTPADLRAVKPLGKNHRWIEKQIEHVSRITALFNGEIVSFYNVFAAATLFKFLRWESGTGDAALARLIKEDAQAVRSALDAVAEDLAVLAGRVTAESGVDGIYFSTQDVGGLTPEQNNAVVRPSDESVLRAGGGCSILHICGYEGHHNGLSRYADYPAQILNWAVSVEGIPLGAGKTTIFGGRPVIGGFANTKNGILYRGTREEVEAETARILAESGHTGIILGADCTIPKDINLERLEWVRKAGQIA